MRNITEWPISTTRSFGRRPGALLGLHDFEKREVINIMCDLEKVKRGENPMRRSGKSSVLTASSGNSAFCSDAKKSPTRVPCALTTVRIVLLLVLICAGVVQTSLANTNPIKKENLKPGTTDWQLTNPADNRQIEGYASL